MAVLPLFPLPVVLFPGAFLPLHIFEPRYRRLVADQVEANHRFVLLPPGPDGSPPPLGTVGTVAKIRAVQPLSDGRSNIVVSGEERVSLEALTPKGTPYMVGEVAPLPDESETQITSAADLHRLREMGRQYAEALLVLERGEAVPEWSEEAGPLSFQIASLAEWEFEAQHRFLRIRSVAERVARLLAALPRLIARAEANATIHRRATQNGTGHA